MQTPASSPIRVVAIDDSFAMRHMYQMILSPCADMDLIGMASDGPSGLEMVHALNPDLVLLDVNMPGMDGMVVLSKLHEQIPHLPIIMCSTLTQRGAAVTLEALYRGAADYVAKPNVQGTPQAAMEAFRAPLVERIRALGARVQRGRIGEPSQSIPTRQLRRDPSPSGAIEVVLIGASTGGPQALEQVLRSLPADFPVPVVVVQHIPPMFVPLLAERLQKNCRLQICEAAEGTVLQAGMVWLARGDWHLRLVAVERWKRQGNSSTIQAVQRLSQDEPIHYCRPSVDALFLSAAETYKAAALAVVLTGMGSDATDGARAICAAGGTVLAQDAATSTIWGMPGSVVQAGLAHAVLPLDQIAGEIVRRVCATTSMQKNIGLDTLDVPQRTP
ncbi:MAG TPA: chemotaxis-specific protein-glutamate methyltransferase CheB [Acidobacteriaceae bacterium]|nr:chemotaxis-specific protein-glutamate methyltransferase CheB [Acidobacteriaceae bacterium]